jgi:hypothetical protein
MHRAEMHSETCVHSLTKARTAAEGHYMHVLQELETTLKCGQELLRGTHSSLVWATSGAAAVSELQKWLAQKSMARQQGCKIKARALRPRLVGCSETRPHVPSCMPALKTWVSIHEIKNPCYLSDMSAHEALRSVLHHSLTYDTLPT